MTGDFAVLNNDCSFTRDHWRGCGLRFSAILTLTTLILAFNLIASGCEGEEWPEGLPRGETILPAFDDPDTPGAYFDFSAGELVYGDEGRQRGDIYLDRTFIAGNPAHGVALHDAMANSLLYDSTMPGWGSTQWKRPPNENTPARVPIYNGHCMWVLTAEGNTAKFKIRMTESNADVSGFLRIKIEWTYQPDGSNELHAVPAEGAADGAEETG